MHLRRQRFANERLVVLLALGTASALCVALELFRERHYGALSYRFLVWNLVLAWIPFVLALFAYDRYQRGTRFGRLAPVLVLWLLFLPNAPYIVTDFVHLSATSGSPLWLDGIELSGFAWTGMLLGFVSIYLLHAVVRHRFGPAIGWAGAFAVLMLGGAGVYLGRVKRWNSWDLLTQPGNRLAQLHAHLDDPLSLTHAFGATLAMGALLMLAYLVFCVLVGTRFEPGLRRSPAPRLRGPRPRA